jgi:3-hydroxyisobutyrate dehydrogenase-like beta-hydroxyacid dehydrogenase
MEHRTIGVIGLGDMGGGIAANLVRAGYTVYGYDLKEEEVVRFLARGGLAASGSGEILARCDVVLVSVEGRDAIRLTEGTLLPGARPGQTFIDHSTVPVHETQRLGRALEAKGCRYLDAPTSGGRAGAEAGTLRIFVGGDRETAEDCWPIFEAIGNPEKVVYCGPLGMGQVAKVVQQLTTRFPDVARMEVMAFGLRGGLPLATVMRALDVDPESNDPYARLYRAAKEGATDGLSAEFSEWHYYLAAARAMGFYMPMLEAMYAFCKDAPRTHLDPLERPEPSIWNELMRRGMREEG